MMMNTSNKTHFLTYDLALEQNAISGKIFDINILTIAIENSLDTVCTINTKDFSKKYGITILTPSEILNT